MSIKDNIAKAEQIFTLIRFLAASGDRGAFPAPGTSPLASRFSITDERLEASDRITCTILGNGFDLYGFELLRNMGQRLERNDIVVRRIELSEPEVEGRRTHPKSEPVYENEFDAYPAVSPLVRFTLEGEAGNVGKMRRCLVELTTIVEANHLVHLTDWIYPWFRLLESGAFSMPIGLPTETDSFCGDVVLFDEQSIEIGINRFQASETAWHALINMLDTYWRTTPLISKVLID